MTIIRRTGGLKEFRYTKEDIERIESTDTPSTKAFKEGLREWYASKNKTRRNFFLKEMNVTTSTSNFSKKINKKRYGILALLLIIFLTAYFILVYGEISYKVPIQVEKTKVVKVNQTIPSKISFSTYFQDMYKYDQKPIRLKGYLMRYVEGDDSAGVYVESIKDDYGARIDFINMPTEYLRLFPKVGETEDLYEISGIFIRKYKKLYLDVSEISQTERDQAGIKEIEKNVIYFDTIKVKNKTKVYDFVTNKFASPINILNKSFQNNKFLLNDKLDNLKIQTSALANTISTTSSNLIDEASKAIDNLGYPINETQIENRIFELVNKERQLNGAPVLVRNNYLDDLAKSHSKRMIEEDFFEHSNFNLGENIFYNPIHYNVEGCGSTLTSNQQSECIVSGWISSPGHHANMIDYGYVSTGIGVACDLSSCKATEVFR